MCCKFCQLTNRKRLSNGVYDKRLKKWIEGLAKNGKIHLKIFCNDKKQSVLICNITLSNCQKAMINFVL